MKKNSFFILFVLILTILISYGIFTKHPLLQSFFPSSSKTPPPPQPQSTEQKKPTVLQSIVRVNVTTQRYNFFQPWEKHSPVNRNALGVILKNKTILVTAELIADATYIELEKAADRKKETAEVVAVDYEKNLALIAPKNKTTTFFDSTIPLEVHTKAKPGDAIEIWQIEANGTPLQTSGEISKVLVASFFIENSFFLQYDVKTSLQYESGSFTLPVIKDNQLIGLLLSFNTNEQVASVLAASTISHFLHDLEDGHYAGFPDLGIRYTQTVDEQLRNYVQLKPDQGGVYITHVIPGGSAESADIKEGDILLEIDGHAIDARGNYKDTIFGTLNLLHIAEVKHAVGDQIPMKILRNGEIKEVEVTLVKCNPADQLIDNYMFDRGPNFYILGGIIFQELTKPYLENFGRRWRDTAPFNLHHALNNPYDYKKEGREKLVFLSRVIPSPITLGYESLNHLIVTKVNNHSIQNIKDLQEAFNHPIHGIHHIEFLDYPRMIFVDAAEAKKINTVLLQQGITKLNRME